VFVVDDVVFLTISWLSSYILGPIITARCYFNSLQQRKITRDQLARLLNEFRPSHLPKVKVNVDHALKALQYLGVAFEMSDDPGFYCIPAHLPEGNRLELKVWQAQDIGAMTYVGRRLECKRDTDMFTPGLFPFFQCKAAVGHSTRSQLYKGWMKMVKIYKGNIVTECLVEMTNDERAIDVVVRGPTESKRHCILYLDTVMTLLNDQLRVKSPGTQLERYYLSPVHMKEAHIYPAGFKEFDVQLAAAEGHNSKVTSSFRGDIIIEDVCNLFASVSVFGPSHYDSVIAAVLKHGRDQWFSIGVKLDYSIAEVNSICHDKPTNADKLLSIILQKSEDVGKKTTLDLLMKACKSIPSPIYGSVRDQIMLEDKGNNMEELAMPQF
jgi:hypothetical protein